MRCHQTFCLQENRFFKDKKLTWQLSIHPYSRIYWVLSILSSWIVNRCSSSVLIGRPTARILKIFPQQKAHTFSSMISRFLTNIEARYTLFKDFFWKKASGALLQIFSRFQISYQIPIRMMLNWLLLFAWNIVAFCSSDLRAKAYATKFGHGLESSGNALQNAT
jgi:hypothetical protein